jgi:uncharacterized alkaline shock family protein YloU
MSEKIIVIKMHLVFGIVSMQKKYDYKMKKLQLKASVHNGILCSHEEEQNVIIRW